MPGILDIFSTPSETDGILLQGTRKPCLAIVATEALESTDSVQVSRAHEKHVNNFVQSEHCAKLGLVDNLIRSLNSHNDDLSSRLNVPACF